MCNMRQTFQYRIGLLFVIRNDYSLLYLDNLLERELHLDLRVLGLGAGFGLSFGLLDCGPSVLSEMPDLHRSSSKAVIIHVIRNRFCNRLAVGWAYLASATSPSTTHLTFSSS